MFLAAFNPEAENWEAEASRAGKVVGLTSQDVKALMQRPIVIRKLKHREEYGMDDVTSNRLKRKLFWQEIMEDADTVETKDRLRASELWGKAEGDFVQRIEADIRAVDEEERFRRALEKIEIKDGSEG